MDVQRNWIIVTRPACMKLGQPGLVGDESPTARSLIHQVAATGCPPIALRAGQYGDAPCDCEKRDKILNCDERLHDQIRARAADEGALATTGLVDLEQSPRTSYTAK